MLFHSLGIFENISYESLPSSVDEQALAMVLRCRDELKKQRSGTWVGMSLGIPMSLVGILSLNGAVRQLVESKHVDLVPLVISLAIGSVGFLLFRAAWSNRKERKALDQIVQSPSRYKVGIADITRLGVRIGAQTGTTQRVFYRGTDGVIGRSPHIWIGVLNTSRLNEHNVVYAYRPGEKTTIFLGFIAPAATKGH